MIKSTYHASQLKTKDTDDFENVVTTFVGYIHGIDENGKNTTVPFEWDFDTDKLNKECFIEYKDLTKNVVDKWIKTQMPKAHHDYLEDSLKEKIALFYVRKEPQNTALPWD